MTNNLTIYSKMNVYYCDGFSKPVLIANSIKDLFNAENARDYLPTEKEEFKDLKEHTYYNVRHNDFTDVAYSLATDCGIFITKSYLFSFLKNIWGFTEERAKKTFTDYFDENENNKLIEKNIQEFYRG